MSEHIIDRHRRNEKAIAECVQELDHISEQAKRLSEWFSSDKRLRAEFWDSTLLIQGESVIQNEGAGVDFSLFSTARVKEILSTLQEAQDRKERLEACMKQAGYGEYIPAP